MTYSDTTLQNSTNTSMKTSEDMNVGSVKELKSFKTDQTMSSKIGKPGRKYELN